MALVNQFPLAPNEYSADEERAFRAVVQDEIADRLGRYAVPVYGGQPVASAKGTATAFVVPVGIVTATRLPFNTLIADLDVGTAFAPGTNSINALFPMFESIGYSIHHPGGQNSTNIVSAIIFINGAPVATNTITVNLNNPFDMSFINYGSLATGDVVDIRMIHDDNVGVTIDMTRSTFTIVRMTPDPRLLGNDRF